MKNDTITIQIGTEDLELLKRAGYKLCMAGSLEDRDYTVVWYATEKYFCNNKIQVIDEYEVFASSSFVERKAVFINTDSVPITMGKQCVLNEYGCISAAQEGENPETMTLVNEYGAVHPGICQKGKGVEGNEFMNPLFLSRNQILPGEFEFFPSYEIKIWFAQDMETGIALPKPQTGIKKAAKTNFTIIDLEKENAPVRSYFNGKWE